jgi:hypothetical protein
VKKYVLLSYLLIFHHHYFFFLHLQYLHFSFQGEHIDVGCTNRHFLLRK